MNDISDNKTVTRILNPTDCLPIAKVQMTETQMQAEYNYILAQKILKGMLGKGLISLDEFNKITDKNRQTFFPYLAEIMP